MSPGPRRSPAVLLPTATAHLSSGVGALKVEDFKIHCPKCRMSFLRGKWPYQGSGGFGAPKTDGCPDCGVRFTHGSQFLREPGKTSDSIRVSVDPTAARQAWGLE